MKSKRIKVSNPRLSASERPRPIPYKKIMTPAKGKGSYKRIKKGIDYD